MAAISGGGGGGGGDIAAQNSYVCLEVRTSDGLSRPHGYLEPVWNSNGALWNFTAKYAFYKVWKNWRLTIS